MRFVATVQVDDHRGQPFERPGARERPGVERAAGDDPRGKLERERLRLRVVAAEQCILVGRLLVEVRRGDRMQARDYRPFDLVLDALGEAPCVWIRQCADTLAELDRRRDREQRRVAERPRDRARAVSSAPSALTASTTRSAPRTASSFVPPVTPAPSSSAVSRARAASREPITISSAPTAASRAARARPKLPVPPSTATFTRAPRRHAPWRRRAGAPPAGRSSASG